MKITILTDNPNSWILPFIEELKIYLRENHEVIHVFQSEEVTEGDILFILSCEKLVERDVLDLNKNNIVVHPSDLPKQRGWSPLTWQILEGKNTIPICLFEAAAEADDGSVYIRDKIELDGTELITETKQIQGEVTVRMIKKYLKEKETLLPTPQKGEPSFCSRRMPEDSEISTSDSIENQFNKLRVADNKRYPAFFCHKGEKYILKIYKENK